jgi:argininosuccinate lyase
MKRMRLDDLSLDELQQFHPKFDYRALAVLSPEKVVRAKSSYGGTSPGSVDRQIKKIRQLVR